jgi:deferrochelatase/peroxidase EfeB
MRRSAHPGRRGLLLGFGATGGALTARAASLPDQRAQLAEEPADGTQDRYPFHGIHQSGVTTSQPAAALVATFDVLAENRSELEQMFRQLTERCAFLMRGGAVAAVDPKLPPLDSGVLGPTVFPDALTITTAVGSSLFDDRYGLAQLRPRELVAMTRFPNDALDADYCHGDLCLQFSANTAETTIHALRDLVKTMPDFIALRWKLEGFLPPHVVKRQRRDTVRNLMGFKDGTENLDTTDTALMDRQVWVRLAPPSPLGRWAAATRRCA